MGQDTYIDATIYEKSTGRRISEEWFSVFWCCHDVAIEIARAWTKVLSKYTDISSLAEEYEVVFPHKQKSEKFSWIEWNHIQEDEKDFLRYALKLREFICELDRIHYENKYTPLPAYHGDGLQEDGNLRLPDSYIPDEVDLKNYKGNPQAYEWRFRFVDSC